jgi:predicted Zn-dependent peptidase
LVEEEQMLSSIEIRGFDFRAPRTPAPFTVTAILRPDIDPHLAEQRIREEIARAVKTAPSDAEMERAQGALARDFLADTRGDGARGLAFNLAFFAQVHDRPERINTWLGEVDRVTARDLSEVARRYLLRAPQIVVTTLPGGSPASVGGGER